MDSLDIIRGKLTLSMALTVPQLHGRSRVKNVTLARYHYVELGEAKELKAKFLHHNDELDPGFITAKWEFVQYL